jgi:uncharacterized protein YcbX
MPSASPARIAGICRYPVKGLTPEPLPRVALKAGQTLPSDRHYAIENGPSGFDPAAPKWLPKAHFLRCHWPFRDASAILVPVDGASSERSTP